MHNVQRVFLAIAGLWISASPVSALPPQSTTLTSLPVSATTGEKPQSKVWTQDGRWFCVMPSTSVTSGTWVWRLDGTTWTNVLQLSAATGTHADVKSTGAVAHVLLYNGGSSQLASIEYVPGTQTYQMWTTRPTNALLPLSSSTETASLDIDSQGRMWIATDYAAAASQIVLYYADAPYSDWSAAPVTLAMGINADDIAVVTAMPDGTVGVLWSNQVTQRFGFKRHADGADPSTWSLDEVPASQSALNQGLGMADDHLNVAVASDGTLYAAVKTSYDTAGFPKIALLVRRPAGTWDNLYEVDQNGTRGIVLLDETAGVVTVLYTSTESGGSILYKESPTAAIVFGSSSALMPATLNDVTSTKQNLAGEVVILAGNGSSLSGRLLTTPAGTYTITATAGAGGTITPSGAVVVGAGANQAFTIAPNGGYVIADVLVDGGSVGVVTDYTFTNVGADHTIAASFTPAPSGDLVGRWRMNEGSGAVAADDSPNGLDGALVGSPAWVAGVEGPFALSFTNGVSQRVQVPNTAALNVTSATTLAAWIRPTQVATASILNKATFSTVTYGYELNLSSTGVPFVRLFNDTQAVGGGRLNATIPYPTNGTTWMHVAATYDGATIRMYINGVLNVSRAATAPLTTNTLPLVIGAPSDGAANRVFPGAIDDARLYNRALTAGEIAAIASLTPTWTITASAGAGGVIAPAGAVVVNEGADQGFTITADAGYHVADVLVDGGSAGPVANYLFTNVTAPHTIAASFAQDVVPGDLLAWWPYEEGSGAAILDASGNGNHGTLPAGASWSPGVSGLALGLNGSSQRASVPDSPTLDISGAITMATWVKPSRMATQHLIHKGNNASDNGYEISLAAAPATANGRPFVRFNNAANGNLYRLNGTQLYPFDGNTWFHLAATYDGATIRLYVNGVMDSSKAATFTVGTNNQPFAIGSQSDGQFLLQGSLDDTRIYGRALSAAEIAALAGLPPVEHTITASAGSGGAIAPSGAVAVVDGEDVTFTITPADCFTVAEVLVDGVPVGPVGSYTFPIVTADHSIAASFAPVPAFTITASAGTGGSISPSGTVAAACGSTQAFTITADPGYAIDHVLVDGSSVGAVAAHTFTNVHANHTIASSFVSTGPPADNVAPVVGPGQTIAGPGWCLTVPVVFTRADATPLRGYSVTFELSPNLQLCGAQIASAGYPQAPQTFQVTALPGNRWTVDEVTLGLPCGVTGSATLFDLSVTSLQNGGTGTITVASTLARDCVNGPIAIAPGLPATVTIEEGVVPVVDPPRVTRFASPWPTPFVASTTLQFELAEAGPTELAMFAVNGRRVRTLANGFREIGVHRLTWDGADDQGVRVRAGVYFARLTTGDGRHTQTLVLAE